MNKNEIEFLKNYYKLLKDKNLENIGDRYINQIEKLFQSGEISKETLQIITSFITAGKNGCILNDENYQIIKDLINIGKEIKEQKDSKDVFHKLLDNNNNSHSTTLNQNGFSGSTHGGC